MPFDLLPMASGMLVLCLSIEILSEVYSNINNSEFKRLSENRKE